MGQTSSDDMKGREAAQALWRLGLDKALIEDPLTAEFAQAALAELEELQHGTPGVLREVLEGAQMSAEQLNVESFRALIEIVQNADDLHASEVRVAIRKSGKQRRLLIAHNGDRVNLRHVIAMTLAFVSTKRDDPRAKGRFGIGLKTLGRLGDLLTVHCSPYDFSIEGNHVRAVQSILAIPGFYDPGSTETLLDLQLREGFDVEDFQTWFAALGSKSLIFLDAVRSLQLVDTKRRKALIEFRLTEVATDTLTLPTIPDPCYRTTLRELNSSRSWQRYTIDRKMPRHLYRRYKAREDTTPIAIALPAHEDSGQIYAGLPLGAPTQLPLSINAQFDIDLARSGIQHEPMNKWLFQRLGELIAAVALQRLATKPSEAWRAIPLKVEQVFADDLWIANCVADLVEDVHTRVRRGFRMHATGGQLRLSELAYEAVALDQLLTETELGCLRPGLTLVPQSARDRERRWRTVLAEIGGAHFVDVRESLNLLDREDFNLSQRGVRWFIKLARAAIEADLGTTLWSLRSIITADGTRIVPPMVHHEGEILLRSAQTDSLAFRLGLAHVIDPLYLSKWADAAIVRKWLEEKGMLRSVADPAGTLEALASRDWNGKLPTIDDDKLRLIRDAFATLDQRLQVDLGRRVGGVILVEVHRWERIKRVTSMGRPSDAYLPASIEDRKDGWSKAAGRTQGLSWIHPRYEDVLRRPGRRLAGSVDPKPLAARALFGLLGAEVAPRVAAPTRVETRYNDPANPIDQHRLSVPQVEALGKLARHATHLKGERLSPDLLAVLKDIQRERGLRARRERARALLNTLQRDWGRLYEPYTTADAVWSYASWHRAGTIPTSWLGSAMSEAWLTSEDGKKKAPRDLAIRTPATEAILGSDRGLFAADLDVIDAASAAVRALGIQTDPQVSEMVEQLTTLRDGGGTIDERSVMVRYGAIAANCKKAEPAPDDMIGDLPMRKLRARFGTRLNKPGLIYTKRGWLPSSTVFLGAPIFGHRRAFVSERSPADRLWKALQIVPPSITDCVEVLTEIAREKIDETDQQILVNTYYHLENLLPKASRWELTRLRNLPLWNGTAWQTDRPIYVVAYDEVAQALSSRIDVWQLPVGATTVPRLIDATDATLLTEKDFDPIVNEKAFIAGALLEQQFGAAVELLRDWLTRHDPKLFAAGSIPWEALADSRIAIDSDLQITLRRVRRARVSVPARAHLIRTPLTFYFADAEAPGEDDAGGRVIASLFVEGDRDKLALAWSRSWDRAGKGERGRVTLVQDSAEGQALDTLFAQAKGTTPVEKRTKETPRREISKIGSRAQPSLPVRRLKRIEDLFEKVVEVVTGNDALARKTSRRQGLRHSLPPGRSIGDSKRAPETAPLAYSPQEREDLALQILQHAINGDSVELRDYRHLRGVGADARDKLHRYFELKAVYGTLPDDVSLTAAEVERGLREGDKFFLVVVAGLEEGYETVVKIFSNPLRTLNLKPNTSVTLAGIRSHGQAVEVRFPSLDDGATEAEAVG